ncbi:hypothetical protein Sa4125_20960 [Aureimonas sp. SA4125]|uniref:hypothetical protein n=1 Tax=Aureimonas sp. SA4125 TaxID=2826993 RepID=UPI001CC63E33|nr:hypothetical protein [Aureimonas sp. SA4125]BDA84554.1 hypothetical protein Sa4125_20960 [Aureimonas sp. SA4125]
MVVDLTKLAQRRAALESKLAATTMTLREAERRLDSRRKVILGGTLLAALRDGSVSADTLTLLVCRMSERDRALFVDEIALPKPDFEGAVQ